MVDGGFEATPSAWVLGGTPGFADIQTSVVRSGAKALHIRLRNSPGSAGGQADSAPLYPPFPEGAIGVTFYLRHNTASAPTQFVFRIYHFPDGRSQPKVFVSDILSDSSSLNVWKLITFPVHPIAGDYAIQFVPQDLGGGFLGSIDWYVDDVRLLQQPDELAIPGQSYAWHPVITATPTNGAETRYDLDTLFTVDPVPATVVVPTPVVDLWADDLAGADNSNVDPWVDRALGTVFAKLGAFAVPKLFNSVLNGHKAVRCVSSGQTLASPAALSIGGGWTVAVVYGAPAAPWAHMYGGDETVPPTGTSNTGLSYPSTAQLSQVTVAYNVGAPPVISQTIVTPGAFNVVIVRRNMNGSHYVWFNGIDCTLGLPASINGALILRGLFSLDSDSLAANGTQLLTAQVWDSDIGSPALGTVHNALIDYYGLSFPRLDLRVIPTSVGAVTRVVLDYLVERDPRVTIDRKTAPLIQGLRPRAALGIETLTMDAQASLAAIVAQLVRPDVAVSLSLDGGSTRRVVGEIAYRGPEPLGGKTTAGARHTLTLTADEALRDLPTAGIGDLDATLERLLDGEFQQWITATNATWWTETVSGGSRVVQEDFAVVFGDSCVDFRRVLGPPASCRTAQLVVGLPPGRWFHLSGYIWPTGAVAYDFRVRLLNLTQLRSWSAATDGWVTGTTSDAVVVQPTVPFWSFWGTGILIDPTFGAADVYQVELDSQCPGVSELYVGRVRLRGPLPPVGGARW